MSMMMIIIMMMMMMMMIIVAFVVVIPFVFCFVLLSCESLVLSVSLPPPSLSVFRYECL